MNETPKEAIEKLTKLLNEKESIIARQRNEASIAKQQNEEILARQQNENDKLSITIQELTKAQMM